MARLALQRRESRVGDTLLRRKGKMIMKPTLVVMAAGMGSRYGGLKQIDPIGPNGEIVIDYSVFDALRAGFGKVVFVIRRDIEQAFKEAVEPHFKGRVKIDYAFQSLDALPAGFRVPPGREKPWGTGQAILACRDAVREPFAVINADDFYGRASYEALARTLAARGPAARDYLLVGFGLANTLSEHGAVSRGVCEVKDGRLVRVTERTKIERRGGVIMADVDGRMVELAGDTVVSMNMWGFTPALFPQLEAAFVRFLKEQGAQLKSEFFIPSVVDDLIQQRAAAVDVVPTAARWLGMTYTEDKPLVRDGIRALIACGEYPSRVWPQ